MRSRRVLLLPVVVTGAWLLEVLGLGACLGCGTVGQVRSCSWELSGARRRDWEDTPVGGFGDTRLPRVMSSGT